MEQFIDTINVGGRTWHVHATIETDKTVSFIRIQYGFGERTFKPGQENDEETKAAMALVNLKLPARNIRFVLPVHVPPEDDDFEVIE